jgi:hypothetical protein
MGDAVQGYFDWISEEGASFLRRRLDFGAIYAAGFNYTDMPIGWGGALKHLLYSQSNRCKRNCYGTVTEWLRVR